MSMTETVTANRIEKRELVIPGKGKVSIELDVGGQGPQLYSLGIRKSGSTMLHSAVIFLARRNGVNVVDLPGTFFQNGIAASNWLSAEISDVLLPGNIYVGFRAYPEGIANSPAFVSSKKVFMFRDPRDALVSLYYSDAYSHRLPSAETETGAKAAESFMKKRALALNSDINDYVIQHAKGMAKTMLEYKPMLNDPNCMCFRYEDYVFQKRRLFSKIVSHFGWKCNPPQMERLLQQLDKIPDNEDDKKFVRRVIPGDHRRKLNEPTIKRISNITKEALAVYDYC